MIFLTDNFSPYGNFPEREEPRENKTDIPPSRENREGNAREEAPFGNGYPFGNQYPYGGQPPYGNQPPYGQYPYGNQPPYGGYPYRKKPSAGDKISAFIKKLTAFFSDRKVLTLSLSSIAAAGAVILFEIFGTVFGTILGLNETLYTLYTRNPTAEAVFGMIYTLLGVALPFFLAYIFLKKTAGITLPLGAPRKNSGVAFLVPAGLGVCYIGNIAVSYMMTFFSSFGISSYSYDMALTQQDPLPENAFQLICTVMYMAVFPAFFEEFAFRGVIMQPLRKYGDWFAIIVSGVMFGLVHGNLMQMPFAIIAGVALGYAAIVTDSLWTGIIIHFLNNFLSVIFSWARTGLSDGTNLVFSALFTYGIIIIGVVALTGYSWKNPRMMKLYPSKVDIKKGKAAAVYFLMPAMLVALLLMLKNILTDITVG